MPYRVDVRNADLDVFDRLVALGALDIELTRERGIAALMPDSVAPGQVASELGRKISVAPAIGRDADSVWLLSPRAVRIGRVSIVPARFAADPGAVRDSGAVSDPGSINDPGTVRLIDAPAFGTGLHPTTALCVEAIDEAVQVALPEAVLDVGTGSGVLALAALTLGVPRALALDLDGQALAAAAENARINALNTRLQLARGGPDAISGTWPLVVVNILAAPLIEMAPALVRRVGHQGRLLLSGISSSVESEVDAAYRHLGMRRVSATSRGGWVAIVLQASW